MYLQELLNAKTQGRYSLRSDALGLLVVLVTKFKTFGDCAFAVAVPRVWNSSLTLFEIMPLLKVLTEI